MPATYLNTNTMGHATASPVSTAMTVNTGSRLVAYIPIAYNSAADQVVTAVSLGGVAATRVGTPAHSNASGDAWVELWRLVNPPTGSQTLSITMTGTITDIYYNVIVVSDANQTIPEYAGSYQALTPTTDGSGNASVTITCRAQDLSMTAVNGEGAAIITTNQTSDGTNGTGAKSGASDHGTVNGTNTHTWSGTAAITFALVGVAINGDAEYTVAPYNVSARKKRVRTPAQQMAA